MKKVDPPLRNYQQMMRVVQDKADSGKNHGNGYSMASAFGKTDQPVRGLDLRLRTLEESGFNAVSPRRPGPVDKGGEFDARTSSIYYHQLNDNTQSFFSGVGGPLVQSRNDLLPGTKQRTSFGEHSYTKKVEPTVTMEPMQTPQKKTDDKTTSKD